MADSPLRKVELHTDVYMVCLQHALSTESFEVMGLLIGNVCHYSSLFNILLDLSHILEKIHVSLHK